MFLPSSPHMAERPVVGVSVDIISCSFIVNFEHLSRRQWRNCVVVCSFSRVFSFLKMLSLWQASAESSLLTVIKIL